MKYFIPYILIMASVAACSPEIDYKVKLCTGYDGVLYITDDLVTYGGWGSRLSYHDIETGVASKNFIEKKEYEKYYKYSGRLELIVFKNINDIVAVDGFKVKKFDDYYTISRIFNESAIEKYFISKDNVLLKIESETIYPRRDGYVMTTDICGGHFDLD